MDVAIRLAHLPDSNLIAIKLGEVRQLTCASPDYLSRRGVPRQPVDLDDHEYIGINSEGDSELWAFSHPARIRSCENQGAAGSHAAFLSVALAPLAMRP